MAAINPLALQIARLEGKIDAVFGMIPKMAQFDDFAISTMPCHPTHFCPSSESYSNFAQEHLMNSYNQRPRNDPFSNAYNSAWMNHHNLSWKSDNYLQNPASCSFQPKADSSLEDTMEMLAQNTLQFQQSTNNMLQSNSAAISKMETQLGQIADAIYQRELGKFPSQTLVLQRNHEEAKAITMLRSGKLIDNGVNDDDSNFKSDLNAGASQEDMLIEEENKQPPQNSCQTSTTKSDLLLHKAEMPYIPPIPFPGRLAKSKQDKSFKESYDLLSKVNINLPLLDVIRNMPAYGKFFKELNNHKRIYGPNEKVVCLQVEPGDVLEVAQTKPPNEFKEESGLMEDSMDPLIAQVVDSWDFKVP